MEDTPPEGKNGKGIPARSRPRKLVGKCVLCGFCGTPGTPCPQPHERFPREVMLARGPMTQEEAGSIQQRLIQAAQLFHGTDLATFEWLAAVKHEEIAHDPQADPRAVGDHRLILALARAALQLQAEDEAVDELVTRSLANQVAAVAPRIIMPRS